MTCAGGNPIVEIEHNHGGAQRIKDGTDLVGGQVEAMVGLVEMGDHLGERVGDDTDGIQLDQGVVVQLLGPQRKRADHCQQLVNLGADVAESVLC